MDWTQRGEAFIRRVNAERALVDPRINVLTEAKNKMKSTGNDNSLLFQSNVLHQHTIPPCLRPQLEEEEDAITRSPVALLQFATNVFTLNPRDADCIYKLFDVYTTHSSTSSDAQELIRALDVLLKSQEYEEHVLIIDVGLMDGLAQRFAQQREDSLFFPQNFGNGRIAACPATKTLLPTLSSLFQIASTMCAWLSDKSTNQVLILASNHQSVSLLLGCCFVYSSTNVSPERLGYLEGLQVMQRYYRFYRQEEEATTTTSTQSEQHHHVLGGFFSSLLADLRSSLDLDSAPQRGKQIIYHHDVPAVASRYLLLFAQTLARRDRHVLYESIEEVKEEEKDGRRPGYTLLPRTEPIYIHRLSILSSSLYSHDDWKGQVLRPYFVLSDASGTLVYSSFVQKSRSIDLSTGPHHFPINVLLSTDHFVLRMYHLPPGQSGRFLFECSSHLHFLTGFADSDSDSPRHIQCYLRLDRDFDCISTTLALPSDLTIELCCSMPESGRTTVREDRRSSVDASCASLKSTTVVEIHKHASLVRYPQVDVDLHELFPFVPSSVLDQALVQARGSTVPAQVIESLLERQLMEERVFQVPTDNRSSLSFAPLNIQLVTPRFGILRLCRVDMSPGKMGDANVPEFVCRNVETCQTYHLARSDLPETLPQMVKMALMKMNADRYIAPSVHMTPVKITPEQRQQMLPVFDYYATYLSCPVHSFRAASPSTAPPQYVIYKVNYRPVFNGLIHDRCSICQMEFEPHDRLRTLPCFHVYHSNCIDMWVIEKLVRRYRSVFYCHIHP